MGNIVQCNVNKWNLFNQVKCLQSGIDSKPCNTFLNLMRYIPKVVKHLKTEWVYSIKPVKVFKCNLFESIKCLLKDIDSNVHKTFINWMSSIKKSCQWYDIYSSM